MTNGYVDITIGANKLSLFFGRQSVEEFARRTEKYLTDNGFKIATDVVFSGAANYATKHDLPVLTYEQVYDMMEEFSEQEDYSEQYERITSTFWESKYGADYAERLAELKKKVEQEIQEIQEQNQETEKPSPDIGTT